MDEIWKDIEGYEGLYQVSNMGRVRSLERYVKTKGGALRIEKEKILKPSIDKYGYLNVCLHKDGRQRIRLLHRLVAKAFIENTNNLPTINHKDENKANNRVENLEWASYSYNNNYGKRNNIVSKKLLNKHGPKAVLQIDPNTMAAVKEWPSTMECGRNGYHQANVQKCCRGLLKMYKGFIWKYMNSTPTYTEKRKIIQIDPSTNKAVAEWNSAKEASRHGFTQSCISKCCRGEQTTHHGFIWRYKEDVSPTSPPNSNGGPTPHLQGENPPQPNPRPK